MRRTIDLLYAHSQHYVFNKASSYTSTPMALYISKSTFHKRCILVPWSWWWRFVGCCCGGRDARRACLNIIQYRWRGLYTDKTCVYRCSFGAVPVQMGLCLPRLWSVEVARVRVTAQILSRCISFLSSSFHLPSFIGVILDHEKRIRFIRNINHQSHCCRNNNNMQLQSN